MTFGWNSTGGVNNAQTNKFWGNSFATGGAVTVDTIWVYREQGAVSIVCGIYNFGTGNQNKVANTAEFPAVNGWNQIPLTAAVSLNGSYYIVLSASNGNLDGWSVSGGVTEVNFDHTYDGLAPSIGNMTNGTNGFHFPVFADLCATATPTPTPVPPTQRMMLMGVGAQASSVQLPLFTVINMWGDSLTAGDRGTNSVPYHLEQSTGLTVVNQGFGGQTSTEIKDRVLASSGDSADLNIFWVGTNDLQNGTPELIVPNLQTMAAWVTDVGGRFLVIPPYSWDQSPYWKPDGANYTIREDIVAQMKSLFGPRYVYLYEYLVDLYDSGDAQQVIDFGHYIIPYIYRDDVVHVAHASMYLESDFIQAYLEQLGWI